MSEMPTIGEVYNPLVVAALRGDRQRADQLLDAVAVGIYEANPGRCPSVDDGRATALRNLEYYCQYFSAEIAEKVKQFYSIPAGFLTLGGLRIQGEEGEA